MKKIIGFIVLAFMLILPIGVNAQIGLAAVENSQDDNYLKMDITLTITGNDKTSSVGGTMKLHHLEYDRIENLDPNWVVVSGSNTSISFKTASGENIGAGTYKIATVVLKKDGLATSTDKCFATFIPCFDNEGNYNCEAAEEVTIGEKNICKIIDGKFYGKNGNEVTEEVYNKECVNNPKTGNFIPYIIITSGVLLAISVFTISRKNNKLFKI